MNMLNHANDVFNNNSGYICNYPKDVELPDEKSVWSI